MTTAEAPSLVPGAFPAVTVLSGVKMGGSLERASRVVSGRGASSLATTVFCPFFPGTSTGKRSSSKAPLASPAAQRCWLRRAQASCISRVMPYSPATAPPMTAMWTLFWGHHSPSSTMASFILMSFIRAPQRASLTR